jgi:Ca-activated chloride channel family protein
MKRVLSALVVILALASAAQARGLLIPTEKNIPPLALLNHRVDVNLEDQVAVTKVEQTFRNHTTRQLEATYIFPVPKGASVREFAMWVDGKRVKGELLEAAKAKQIYTDIVRQTQDPGLLEYMGTDLLRMQVFPIPPKGDQKIEVSYSSIAKKDIDVVEYTYPLRTDGRAAYTLEDFTLKATLKSQQPLANVYSPTHSISVQRKSDREAIVGFEKNQAALDRDFQLFYTTSGKDVGLTALQHRPISTEDGYFMLLISPRAELSESQIVPRDLVFVLDTSGSMLADGKLEQAKKALKHCLDGLSDRDRFGLINFSTTVNRYREQLTPVNKEQITEAKKWVDRLEATGGTAINDAMQSALGWQNREDGRTFTVGFFTDGRPTIGETNPDKILANVTKKNTTNTRIFTFGVGNDVNATMLDQLAEQSRAVSSYVRPEEDIEIKVSSFFAKINRPVLANLTLAAGNNIRLLEVYPPQLPDLFHGEQLVVLGRYQGAGHTALTLHGTVGKESREFVYELDFAAKVDGKNFVEDLWARRKVGYLLEQIRLNGEKKELVDEVTSLAKKYGIATPYTSWLIVPDAPIASTRPAPTGGPGPGFPGGPGSGGGIGGGGFGGGGFGGGFGGRGGPGAPPALMPPGAGGAARRVEDFARGIGDKDGAAKGAGGSEAKGLAREELGRKQAEDLLRALEAQRGGKPGDEKSEGIVKELRKAEEKRQLYAETEAAFRRRDRAKLDEGKSGVDLTVTMKELKEEKQVRTSAVVRANGRNLIEIGGVWVDEGFAEKTPALTIKYLSDAYFKVLEKHADMKEVFKLGQYVVWIAPSGTALIIDVKDGKEQLSEEEIAKLFTAGK